MRGKNLYNEREQNAIFVLVVIRELEREYSEVTYDLLRETLKNTSFVGSLEQLLCILKSLGYIYTPRYRVYRVIDTEKICKSETKRPDQVFVPVRVKTLD